MENSPLTAKADYKEYDYRNLFRIKISYCALMGTIGYLKCFGQSTLSVGSFIPVKLFFYRK